MSTRVGNCPAPAIETRTLALPSASNHSVVYILNPLNGETVAPWDPNNPYFDTELCKENILGLAPGTAASCPVSSSSVPSGSNWYTTLNDTQTTAGIYRTDTSTIPTPFPFKWVRIAVKTDKMTPAYVSQAPTGDTVECWNGKHQVPATVANGYNADCSARNNVQLFYNGSVCSMNGTLCNINPPIGVGYTTPVVNISGGGGSGATATAHATTSGGGQVTAITIGNAGVSYTAPPVIGFTGGGGSGATAVATLALSGAGVHDLANVTQTTPVGCYATTPSVAISSADGKGSGATAIANMTGNTCIAKWSLAYGSGTCTQSGTITVGASGSGSGFAGSVTLKANKKGFTSYSITNPGSGYTSVPTLSGLTGCSYTATFTLGTQVKGTGSLRLRTPAAITTWRRM